ncbi:response regulator [Hyalangium versicolor]|uniref:response regulator n=1 Tax=Hyalangium versicolor TaxID=2861190 RepID=UPI002107E0AD|nr:response regulator [Hyalangium versicolor]
MAQALATVREGFRSSASERLSQIRRHAEAWKAGTVGSAALLQQTVHTLRGTASTLGFTEVARIASELEKLAEGESPPFTPRVTALIQALSEAFAHPPSTLPLVPHKPRVLVRLTDTALASDLTRHLEALGLDAIAASSEEEAVRLITSERPVERVVVGPTLPTSLRGALRSLNAPPPVVLLVPTAEARSLPREGADAVLSLGTPPQVLAKEIVSIQRSSPARFRVLAVDDDSAVLATARAVLEAAGMEVVTLNDGRNLFSSLQRHHPDLLLLDIGLPSVDGYELLTQVRGDPAWRSLTVIFHTSRDAPADRVRAFQLGVDDYLIKPVEPAELRLRLMAHLQRRTLLRASAEKDGHTGSTASHGSSPERPFSPSRMEQTPSPSHRTPTPSSSAASRPHVPATTPLPPPLTRPASPPRPDKEGAALPTSRPSLPPVSTPTQPPVRAAPHTPSDGGSAPPRPGSSSRAGDGSQSRSHRILVADDEPALRRVLQRLLEQEGYVVETVEDGEEALARLLNPNLTPVDLLLLDVHMPRRSGIEVLRALREASSPVRSLVLSARIRDEDVMKLYSEGAVDFVAKPFSIHTLLARVTRLLPPRTP